MWCSLTWHRRKVGRVSDAVLHLEQFLQEMGAQIYSHRAHKENNTGSWATSLALASPVAGNDLTVFPHPEQKLTKALEHALNELVTTERTYVTRIEALFHVRRATYAALCDSLAPACSGQGYADYPRARGRAHVWQPRRDCRGEQDAPVRARDPPRAGRRVHGGVGR